MGCIDTGLAADGSPQTSEVDDSDPAFFLRQGQIQSVTTYAYDRETGDAYGYAGEQSDSFEVSRQRVAEQLRYGFTGFFNAYVTGSYVPTDTSRTYRDTGTESSLSSSGFQNPVFGALYRALQQNRYVVNIDLGAAFTPNVVSGVSPSPLHSGSVGSGGSEISLSAAASRIEPAYTLKGTVSASHFDTRSVENQTTLGSQVIQPVWEYTGEFLAYGRFSRYVSAIAGLTYTVEPNEMVTTGAGLPVVAKPGNQGSGMLGIDYNVTPMMYLRLQDQYFVFADGYSNYQTAPLDSSTTRNVRQNSVSLILNVIF